MEGDRHNTGIEACQGHWVLEVVSDERVPDALGREILETIAAAEPGYFSSRSTTISATGWCAMAGARPGASAPHRASSPRGPSVGVSSASIHRLNSAGQNALSRLRWFTWFDRDISDMLQRLDRYTAARALDLRDSGDIGTLPANTRRIFSRFWNAMLPAKVTGKGRGGC